MDINFDSSKKANLNSVNSFLKRYKDYLIPFLVILGSITIFVFVVMPQFQSYLSSREELERETQKLNTLKNNYNFLSNLDEEKNSNDLKILSLALPPNKDFTGIINAISAAASKTGVAIGDFSFSLGDLSKNVQEGVVSSPSIKIEMNLTGDAKSVTNFINETYKTVPVSEIISVKTNLLSSDLIMLFYFKPFPPENVSDEAPVVVMSAENLNLTKKIYSWNNTTDQGIAQILISSASALLSSPSGQNPSPF